MNEDSILNQSVKDHIIHHLRIALDALKQENTNWTLFFGTIKEAIIIGAIGSMAGGLAALPSLFSVNQKLEQAEQVIQITSINQNYLSYSVHNQILSLPESKQSASDSSKANKSK